MDFLNIKDIMLKNEYVLSKYATFDKDAIRIKDEKIDIRPEFFHDIDRIIHSLSYTRYIDKTQVFSFNDNDHLSKRIIHVQLVSKIARTIARALSLNEDLTEAIALGHDIGHTPIGHVGESLLNELSIRETGKMFNHNIHSVRNYLYLENNGKGANLTIQTLDGIMCHNGEMLSNIYEPMKKSKEQFLNEFEQSYTDKNILKSLRPMTLEGCIVRISDIIAYIGRDIEDAISIGIISVDDIPENIKKTLGVTNSQIVNTIICDIIENSIDKNYIKMSKEIYEALFELKKFNYEHIYSKANNDETINKYRECMQKIYDRSMKDIKEKNYDSDIYKVFLSNMNEEYINSNCKSEIVIDYIAGMTDDYFMKNL